MKTSEEIFREGMIEAYNRGYNDSRTLLKYPHEIISLVDLCNFNSEQLWHIIRWLEELKPSDYEWTPDIDMTDDLREQNWDFDK